MKQILSALLLVAALCLPSVNCSATATPAETTIDALGAIMFIGDSYCMGANLDNTQQEISAQSWVQQTIDALGITQSIMACHGGTGFINQSDGVDFQTLLEEHYSDATAGTFGWIIVGGGYNDQYYSHDEIVRRGTQFIERVHELYPSANIAIAMNGWHANDTNIQSALQAVATAYQDLATAAGAVYLSAAEQTLAGGDYFSNDNFHPNAAGQTLLASSMIDFLHSQLAALASTQQDSALLDTSYLTTLVPLGLVAILLASIIIILAVRLRLAKFVRQRRRNQHPY